MNDQIKQSVSANLMSIMCTLLLFADTLYFKVSLYILSTE